MEAIILLVIYGAICFLIAKAGEARKIGFGMSLFLCLLLSPLIGGVITMLSPKIFQP